MIGRDRFRKLVTAVMVICVITILGGYLFITQSISQPHPLPSIEPALVLPGEEVFSIRAGYLVFTIEPTFRTFHFHSGVKGCSFRLAISVVNEGTEIIDDLCFHRMTMYWANGVANFTSSILPTTNHTIEPSATRELSLRNAYDWPGIPTDLCWSGGIAYGRLLLTYNSSSTYILTTPLAMIMNVVE